MKQTDGVPMKHALYIDQLTLEFWAGRKVNPARLEIRGANRERFLNHVLDVEDAFLVAFIADLNPHDEAIKEIMWRDHFLVKLKWLKERLPLLQMTEHSLYRRLRWLRMMGILVCVTRTVDGNKTLAYYRMSALYWKIRAKRHEKAAAAARKVKAIRQAEHASSKSHGPGGPRLGPTRALQDSQGSLFSSPPSPASVEEALPAPPAELVADGEAGAAARKMKAIVPVEHGSLRSHSPCGHEPWSGGTSKAIQDSLSYTPPGPPPPAGVVVTPPAEDPIDREAVAEQAFSQLRQICQIPDREDQGKREERIQAKRRLLAEQAEQLAAAGQLDLPQQDLSDTPGVSGSGDFSPPFTSEGGSNPPTPIILTQEGVAAKT